MDISQAFAIGGYFGYLAVILVGLYAKNITKYASQDEIKAAIEETKGAYLAFIDSVEDIIEDKNINDAETIKFIKNSISIFRE